jgi:hypothetical protein
VTSHFVVHWHHEFADEPVTIYEEVDDARFEIRKVHRFADGRLIRADRIQPERTTSLSWEALYYSCGSRNLS